MRRHQGVPADRDRVPLSRLVAGELGWAIRQVAHSPTVAVGLVGGTAATLAVLGQAAPGPVLDAPWRLIVAVAAGLSVAAALRRLRSARAPTGRRDRVGSDAPLVGAVVLAGAVTALVLVVWLAAWAVDAVW